MIRGITANCTVADLERAEAWYGLVIGRAPDARPMAGLIEWRFADGAGLQVWSEPERSGRSTVVLDETDLEATAARLTAGGVEHDGPQPVDRGRILQLADPDGNRVVFSGA